MQKSDLVQACSHVFNASPLKEILMSLFPGKANEKRIKELAVDELPDFINTNMNEDQIKKMLIGNFSSFTQEIHVFHIVNKGTTKHKMSDFQKMLGVKGIEALFHSIEEVVDVDIHADVGKVYMLLEVNFQGYLTDAASFAPTSGRQDFPYIVPAMVEFLPPYYVKIRVNKYAIRAGNRRHFNGQHQLLLETAFSIIDRVDEIKAAIAQAPLKLVLERTDLMNSVVETANKKEISATVLKWDEKDGVHYTHRGRNNKTLHPYSYIQKVLQKEAIGVGDGVWYFTDPTKHAGSQPISQLSGIRVFPVSGFIAYDSYRKEEIEDKVNEFIKLAK